MIKSMTAYGRGEYTRDDKTFFAEIRSVNHRYRDMILRIPKTWQAMEDEIRSHVTSRVRRGRIEVLLQMKKNGAEMEYGLELNRPLVNSYFQIFKELSERFGVEGGVRADYLCQMKDVIIYRPVELDMEEVKSCIQEALGLALDSMDEMKLREGRAIESDFRDRLGLIEGYLHEIQMRAPGVVDDYRKRLRNRIQEIAGDMELDEGRLAQEVALYADRSDITEEIVRGRSHVKQFHEYMAMGDAVGRRLDFLMQEIFREANTIGSKASDAFISARVVEIKAELERLREQIQNIE